MKKQVVIILGLALLSFSCSTEEVAKSQERNLKLEKDTSLSIVMKQLLLNVEFQNKLNKTLKVNEFSKGQDNGNGVIFVETRNGSNYAFATPEGIFWLSSSNTEDQIKLMPDGTAKFSTKSKNPSASFTDWNWNTIYSNDCIENKTGTFTVNLRAAYFSFTIDIYDPVTWEPTGETATIYFADLGNPPYDSAFVIQGSNIKINNSLYTDPDTWESSCNDATEEYDFFIKNITSKSGQNNFSIELR
ncbi:MAG TPA: hypothetical protein VIS27_12845 [Yeosuana sp.]